MCLLLLASQQAPRYRERLRGRRSSRDNSATKVRRRQRACDAVNVVVSAPPSSPPCAVPAAPPSDCISTTCGTAPQMFFLPSAAHSSQVSAMLDDGVMG